MPKIVRFSLSDAKLETNQDINTRLEHIIEESELIPYYDSDDEICEGIKSHHHKLIKIKKNSRKHKTKHHHEHSHHHDHDDGHDHHHHSIYKHWWKGAIGVLWGVGLLTLSVLSLNIPSIALYCIVGATTITSCFLGKEVYEEAYRNGFKKISMGTLYTISTLMIVGVSIASLFIPGLPLMFEAAPLVLGFWHIGEGIEHTLKESIVSHLKMRDNAPKKVVHEKMGLISVKKLIPNDIIMVRKGREKKDCIIPVDGVLLEDTELFTTKINGSPFSRRFKRGEVVLAGMQLANNIKSARIRVRKTFQKSYLSRIDDNIKQANREKAPIEILTNKILKYFIPGLLCIAVISGIAIGCMINPALAIQCAISVLVSACPCALSLITPLAVKIGMNKAAEQGVNFKNGKTLQAAANIDAVVFDLNGTLTEGRPKVTQFKRFNNKFSEETLIQYIAALEKHSNHSIAKLILNFVASKKLPEFKSNTTEIENYHSGIKAKINGETFFIGNAAMLSKNKITIHNPQAGAVYFANEKEILAQLTIADPLRSDAKETIAALKRSGKEVHICTGADKITAEQYANELKIPLKNICANCVATKSNAGELSKTDYINSLKINKKVAMIGDAANDAIAVTKSDFSIAIKSDMGDEITQENAGAVIQNDSLMSIVTAFEVAKLTKRNIFQNLMVSLTYNSSITLIAGGLLIAFGFALNPAIGIALMVLETTIVLSNTYRFKQQSLTEAKFMPSQHTLALQSTNHKLHTLGLGPGKDVGLKPEKDASGLANGNVHDLTCGNRIVTSNLPHPSRGFCA